MRWSTRKDTSVVSTIRIFLWYDALNVQSFVSRFGVECDPVFWEFVQKRSLFRTSYGVVEMEWEALVDPCADRWEECSDADASDDEYPRQVVVALFSFSAAAWFVPGDMETSSPSFSSL